MYSIKSTPVWLNILPSCYKIRIFISKAATFICQQSVSKRQNNSIDFMLIAKKKCKNQKNSHPNFYITYYHIVVFILTHNLCFCCSLFKFKFFYGMIVKKTNSSFLLFLLNGVSYFYIIPPST
jgi:hypothetical protein